MKKWLTDAELADLKSRHEKLSTQEIDLLLDEVQRLRVELSHIKTELSGSRRMENEWHQRWREIVCKVEDNEV